MKKTLLSLTFVSLLQTDSLANGWSFEPPPRTAQPKTNRVEQTVVPPVWRDDGISLQRISDETFERILDDRLWYSVRGRLNPLRQVDYLALEIPDKNFYDRYVADGKAATRRGLTLTARQYVVRRLHIGGLIGEALGGRRIGTARPSLFDTSEGISGWNQVQLRPEFFRDYDIGRQNPYLTVGYRQADWLSNPLWELRTRLDTRLDADRWQFERPRLEGAGVFYVRPNLAFEGGAQLRNGEDGFGKRVLAFVFGGTLESRRYGSIRIAVAITEPKPEGSIVYWYTF